MYAIVRKFYTSSHYMEWRDCYKEFIHPFTPLTLEEATIIKSKLSPLKNAIDHIILIETKE